MAAEDAPAAADHVRRSAESPDYGAWIVLSTSLVALVETTLAGLDQGKHCPGFQTPETNSPIV